MKTKNKKINEDEIPKSVLKMKQEKARREEEEQRKRNGNRYKEDNENVTDINGRNGKRRNKKNAKNEKKKGKKKIIKRLILILIIGLLIFIGISMAISAHTWKELSKDMFNNKNSAVVDTQGETIAKLGVEQKKMPIAFNEIPQDLKDAYVSIEDERFYSHHGIDIKRTAGAIFSYVIHFGNSSYGGSTITQQLVKNLTGDDTDAITRKVKEWWKAFLLENYFSKDEILGMYLNVIYVGPNIYGVGAGAKYYFDKDVTDLSLAECAFMAGINNSPNSYNPFEYDDNDELIEKRTKIVLQKMLELEKINEEEYNKAIKEVDDGLDFEEGMIETESPIYSYHTDALITDVIEDLAEEKNISEEFAQNYLYTAGLTIHSTQNSDIQDEIEKEFLKSQYMLDSEDGESTSQAAMVIIDHKTGNVLGCVGGLGEKEYFRGLNRATQSQRQTGSSMKPLAVLVPGIDKKIFTGATVYKDEKTTFAKNYTPKNNDGGYLGNVTVRRALESSQNIPFVEMMEQITPKKSIKYLENMGITSLIPGDENLALALGGIEEGVTPLEMAGAYATIANDGKYIEPTFYTTITNNSEKVVLKAKQETRKVFSEQVAYVIKELLKQPVEGNNGTATYCAIPGIDVAAKTGTTDDNFDKWLCGFTPYYTATAWFGYDQNETIYYNSQNPAGIIWANVMRRVHNGLENAVFHQPNKIAITTICADTGMVANSGCKNTNIEYFLWGTVPGECKKHSGSKIITDDKQEDTSGVFVDDDEDLKLDPNDEKKNNIKNEVEGEGQNDTTNDVTNDTGNEIVDGGSDTNEIDDSDGNSSNETDESDGNSDSDGNGGNDGSSDGGDNTGSSSDGNNEIDDSDGSNSDGDETGGNNETDNSGGEDEIDNSGENQADDASKQEESII